jgi:hypothetical protein
LITLKKISAWVWNKSPRNIVINELGLIIRKGETIDLFRRNPHLRYESYLASKKNGVLAQKREYLIPVQGPAKLLGRPMLEVAKEPLKKRPRSSRGLSKEEKDWVELLEGEFPNDKQPLSDKDRWDLERDKMLQDLGYSGQGETGEVFADSLFDDDNDENF